MTMYQLASPLFLCVLLGACSSSTNDNARLCLDKKGKFEPCDTTEFIRTTQAKVPEFRAAKPITFATENTEQRFVPRATNKRLAHYIEQLAMELVGNEHKEQLVGDIAIATFVKFDGSLRQASALGNQIAELFYHELHAFGYEVVDLKNHNYIDRTMQGDFSFTRANKRIMAHGKFTHVLSGTLIYDKRGVLVNTRIINVTNQRVMASASGFIPHFVVQ